MIDPRVHQRQQRAISCIQLGLPVPDDGVPDVRELRPVEPVEDEPIDPEEFAWRASGGRFV